MTLKISGEVDAIRDKANFAECFEARVRATGACLRHIAMLVVKCQVKTMVSKTNYNGLDRTEPGLSGTSN